MVLKNLKCDQCDVDFLVSSKHYHSRMSGKLLNGSNIYCSKECRRLGRNSIIHLSRSKVECLNCKNEFIKRNYQIKKSPNNFCSHSCSCTYQNTHKTKGIRRSKLEIWLETELTKIYPHLNIVYSDKSTINSELDIYIPSLKLAFELNGIFHYEPIFGDYKLTQIKNNDNRKFQACLEHGIELCIIDTSSQKYVKEKTSKKFLDIINQIISTKLD